MSGPEDTKDDGMDGQEVPVKDPRIMVTVALRETRSWLSGNLDAMGGLDKTSEDSEESGQKNG